MAISKFLPDKLIRYCLFLSIVHSMVGCSGNSNLKEDNAAQEVPVVEIVRKDTLLQKTYVAGIQAVRNVEIRNKVAGYLERIYVDEGRPVRRGQLLFLINPQEFNTNVSKANAVLSSAQAEAREADVRAERVRLLVEKDVVAPSELEIARAHQRASRAKIAEARSTLNFSRTNLSYTHIRAPFDGIIDRIPFKVGSLLPEGSLLTSVSDISSVYAYFNIAEDEYLKFFRSRLSNEESNKQVELTLADNSRYSLPGKIETMTSQFDASTGSIALRARFPNPDRILRHGATGDVLLNTRVDNVLLVPQKAVFEIQDRNYVYLVSKDNKVKMKSFVPGPRIADYYIVRSGLKAGDRVVYEGTQSLKDGMSVTPKPVDMFNVAIND